MRVPEQLISKLGVASALIESTHGLVRILSHYDGDGICSAGIISKAVSRCGKRFHTTMASILRDKDLQELSGDFDLLIIADMGSSKADIISKKMIELEKRCIILDHHNVEGRSSEYSVSDGGGIVEINPRFHRIDGTSGCSGSTLSFLLAVTMDPANADLALFSLAGSLADRQHVPAFSELNSGILGLAVERGDLSSKRGMPFSGRSIKEALLTSNDPFVDGISGDEEAVMELLDNLDILPDERIETLDDEKRKVLQSYLYIKLLKNGVPKEMVHELFRDNFYSERYGPLQDLAYTIDGCGRFDKPALGFQIVWGSTKAYEKALEERFENKHRIQKLLLKRKEEGVCDMDHIQWFFIEEDALSGTIAGLAHNYIFDPEKPMIALAEGDDGEIKVSSRGDRVLTSKGLDLGYAMREAGKVAGGSGGGHDVAAGANFLKDDQDLFLSEVDRIVGEQLGGKK